MIYLNLCTDTETGFKLNQLCATCLLIGLLPFFMINCALFEAKPPPPEMMVLSKYSRVYPRFDDDMAFDGLQHAIEKTLVYLQNRPADTVYRFGKDRYELTHVIRSLETFLNFVQTAPTPKELKKFIAENYNVYGFKKPTDVLFTGYYEPFLHGSLQRHGTYQYPIYARPGDIATVDLSLFAPRYDGKTLIGRYVDHRVVPYFDRQEIDQQKMLDDQNLEIAWVNDPIDLFFLHIQGSGRVFLDNGATLSVHYHGSNGQPYRSIGRLLIDEEKITAEEMSMQKIREYLKLHPDEMDRIFNYNPSYVFFKIEEDGPLGYLDVKLTPGRSIAIDRHLFPLPALSFIEAEKPIIDGNRQIQEWVDFSRFVLSQDVGGAIRGPQRVDLFWGNGLYAEIAAGHMKHHGRLYFLVLKPDTSE